MLAVPLAASAVQVGMSMGQTTTTASISPYRSVSTTNLIIGPGSISETIKSGVSSQAGGGTNPGTSGSANQSSDSTEQETVNVLGGSIKSTTTITGTSVNLGTTFASSVFTNL
jgi:hypothetical protein